MLVLSIRQIFGINNIAFFHILITQIFVIFAKTSDFYIYIRVKTTRIFPNKMMAARLSCPFSVRCSLLNICSVVKPSKSDLAQILNSQLNHTSSRTSHSPYSPSAWSLIEYPRSRKRGESLRRPQSRRRHRLSGTRSGCWRRYTSPRAVP